MVTSKMGTKNKSLSVSEKLNIINKVDGVLNAPCIKSAGELGIFVRFTDKMLGQSDAGEIVLRLPQITQIQHTYVIVPRKIELFSCTLLSGSPPPPLLESDFFFFLSFFSKYILGEFHFTLFSKKLLIFQDSLLFVEKCSHKV
jgi:hypothetical protein